MSPEVRGTGAFEEVIETGPFPIRFPSRSELDQDEEWCEVQVDGKWKRVRFHDYHEVYKIPGLYETIFYRTLRCNSPTVVTDLLGTMLIENDYPAHELVVFDLGAGNGMVGESLQNLGTRNIVGCDIIPEAKEAAERDRPWVYNDYLVADMANLTAEQADRLRKHEFNALTTVAALGFGDIPTAAFYTAFNLVSPDGWIAVNIKEGFLQDGEPTGFARLIQMMTRRGVMRMEAYKRYCHRLSVQGDPLYYVAAVGRKLRDIPAEFLNE